MKFLGLEFVPLHEPFYRRLETFWAGFWFLIFVFGIIVFYTPLLCLCFTSFWWLTLFMVTWIYLDKDTCEEGGRPNSWIQNWPCWKYLKNYYSPQLLYDDHFNLDPNRNYIFCSFPHGIIPWGPFTNVLIKSSKFRQDYPDVDVKMAILKLNFFVPVLKEILLALEIVSCSRKSLTYVLNQPGGKKVVILMVGGAEEALYSKPDQYKFVVKNRKGFVRVALENGTCLVPVITFGETDAFGQIENSLVRRFQKFVKKYLGFVPIIFNGRGFFQYTFGLLPRRVCLTTVLGAPIDVQKVNEPTNEEVDDLHAKFIEKLVELFENYKHKCLSTLKDKQLELI